MARFVRIYALCSDDDDSINNYVYINSDHVQAVKGAEPGTYLLDMGENWYMVHDDDGDRINQIVGC